jgi:hypothetical protein
MRIPQIREMIVVITSDVVWDDGGGTTKVVTTIFLPEWVMHEQKTPGCMR